jgi:hypothetical protein
MKKMFETEKLFPPEITKVNVPREGDVGSLLNYVARAEHLLRESLCLVDMYGKRPPEPQQRGEDLEAAWDCIPSHVHICGLYTNEYAATLPPFRFSFVTDIKDNPVSMIEVAAGNTLGELKIKITNLIGFGRFDICWGEIRLSEIKGADDDMPASVILALACGRVPLVKIVGKAVRRGVPEERVPEERVHVRRPRPILNI